MLRQRSLMKKMNFRRALYFLVTLVPLFFLGCETLEPKDPRASIPGLEQYYNEALRFTLRYPRVLNLKVEDRAVAGEPDIVLRLEYPGKRFSDSGISDICTELDRGSKKAVSSWNRKNPEH